MSDPELQRILEKKYREILEKIRKPRYGFPIVLNENNFDEEISKPELAVVDFWAEWCMPCKIMAPIIEELAKEYPEILFGKVNVDENPILANRFSIQAIPTFLIFKKGKIVDRLVGALPKHAFKKVVTSYLSI